MSPGNNWIRRATGDAAVPQQPRLKLLRIGPPRNWLARALRSVVGAGRPVAEPKVRPLEP